MAKICGLNWVSAQFGERNEMSFLISKERQIGRQTDRQTEKKYIVKERERERERE